MCVTYQSLPIGNTITISISAQVDFDIAKKVITILVVQLKINYSWEFITLMDKVQLLPKSEILEKQE